MERAFARKASKPGTEPPQTGEVHQGANTLGLDRGCCETTGEDATRRTRNLLPGWYEQAETISVDPSHNKGIRGQPTRGVQGIRSHGGGRVSRRRAPSWQESGNHSQGIDLKRGRA